MIIRAEFNKKKSLSVAAYRFFCNKKVICRAAGSLMFIN